MKVSNWLKEAKANIPPNSSARPELKAQFSTGPSGISLRLRGDHPANIQTWTDRLKGTKVSKVIVSGSMVYVVFK